MKASRSEFDANNFLQNLPTAQRPTPKRPAPQRRAPRYTQLPKRRGQHGGIILLIMMIAIWSAILGQYWYLTGPK
jgi:hypothetical protein